MQNGTRLCSLVMRASSATAGTFVSKVAPATTAGNIHSKKEPHTGVTEHCTPGAPGKVPVLLPIADIQ